MKKINYVALALVLSAGHALASGIPTVDVANLAQMVIDAAKQAEQAAAQLQAVKDDIAQAEAQFNQHKGLITGNSGYGSIGQNSSTYDYIPTSATINGWEEIYSSMDTSALDGMRNKNGLDTESLKQQEASDKELTNLHTMQGAYKANNARLVNITQLQAAADSATTPQQKQDVQSRIALEQASISNEANRLASIQAVMDRQEKIDNLRYNTKLDTLLKGTP